MPQDERILVYLRQHPAQTSSEIAKALGLPPRDVHQILFNLLAAHAITMRNGNRFEATAA